MSLKGMIDKDLEASFNLGEFAVEATHYFDDVDEVLNVIFDETTDVILDKGEYNGIEATVPSLQVPTHKANNIKHKSLFMIDGETFGVIEIHKQNDSTTKVYLDKQ
jgi:hypothetical protein